MAYTVKITYCDDCPITKAANDGMPLSSLRGVACAGNGCPDQKWEVMDGPPLVLAAESPPREAPADDGEMP